METGEGQQGILRGGWRNDPDDRGQRDRGHGLSERDRTGVEAENLPAATGAPGVDRESKWEVEATGDSDDSGSCRPDGDVSDPGTDIRGGLSGMQLWIPQRTVGPWCPEGNTDASSSGLSGRLRCGPEGIF